MKAIMAEVASYNCGRGLRAFAGGSMSFWLVAACALAFFAHTAQAAVPADVYIGQSEFDSLYFDNDYCRLSSAMAEKLNNPTNITAVDHGQGVQTLPAVPSAALMGLFGFLCLTLVRDRKFWLCLLVAIFSLSLWPVQNCTKLAANATARYAAPASTAISNTRSHAAAVANHGRKRADIDGTSYIALLRQLAQIPSRPLVLRAQHSTTTSGYRLAGAICSDLSESAVFIDTGTSFEIGQVGPELTFWPGFCFDNLAHAPPAAA